MAEDEDLSLETTILLFRSKNPDMIHLLCNPKGSITDPSVDRVPTSSISSVSVPERRTFSEHSCHSMGKECERDFVWNVLDTVTG